LYEFFADKRAVVHAAAARNLERFGANVSAAMAENPPADMRQAARMILDTYVEMNRADPRFRAIRFGDVVDQHLFDPEQDNDTLVATRYAIVLSAELGIPDTPELRRALVLTVKITDVLVDHAFRLDEDGDPWVLDRTRLLIDQHLSDVT
jgi:AcrR family transcriptional regulator